MKKSLPQFLDEVLEGASDQLALKARILLSEYTEKQYDSVQDFWDNTQHPINMWSLLLLTKNFNREATDWPSLTEIFNTILDIAEEGGINEILQKENILPYCIFPKVSNLSNIASLIILLSAMNYLFVYSIEPNTIKGKMLALTRKYFKPSFEIFEGD